MKVVEMVINWPELILAGFIFCYCNTMGTENENLVVIFQLRSEKKKNFF